MKIQLYYSVFNKLVIPSKKRNFFILTTLFFGTLKAGSKWGGIKGIGFQWWFVKMKLKW